MRETKTITPSTSNIEMPRGGGLRKSGVTPSEPMKRIEEASQEANPPSPQA